MLFTKIILITLLSVANSSLIPEVDMNNLVKKISHYGRNQDAIYGQAFYKLLEHMGKKEGGLENVFWNDKTGEREKLFNWNRKAAFIHTAMQKKYPDDMQKADVDAAQDTGCGWKEFLSSYYIHLVLDQYRAILNSEAFEEGWKTMMNKDEVAEQWEKFRVKETIQAAYKVLASNHHRMDIYISSITKYAKENAVPASYRSKTASDDVMRKKDGTVKATLQEFLHLVNIFIENVNVESRFLTNLRKDPWALFSKDKENNLGVISDTVKQECDLWFDDKVNGTPIAVTGLKAFNEINEYMKTNLMGESGDFDCPLTDYISKRFSDQQDQQMSIEYKDNIPGFHAQLSSFQTQFQNLVKKNIIGESIKNVGVELARTYKEAPPKGQPRIVAKWYKKGDCREIKDVIRGSVVFKTMEELKIAFIAFMKDHKDIVTRFKNRLGGDHTGYRDILVNLRVENERGDSAICELQFHHAKVIEFKKTRMHKVYRQTRVIAGMGYALSKLAHKEIGVSNLSKLLYGRLKKARAVSERESSARAVMAEQERERFRKMGFFERVMTNMGF